MSRVETTDTSGKNRKDYCPNCGQLKQVNRINGSYILTELGSIFNFEKGILYTVKELLIRPGTSIRTFILHDRSKLVKPIVYVVVCSLFYTLLQSFLRFEDGYINYSFQEGEASATEFLFTWVSSNYGYANLIMALFIALWLRLVFRKSSFNMFETLILLCFVMGTGMLIFSFIGILDSFVAYQILDKGFLLGFIYTAWAIGQFYDRRKVFAYIKAFFAYMLGVLTFSIAVLILGTAIDHLL